jgi:hypothetical protein
MAESVLQPPTLDERGVHVCQVTGVALEKAAEMYEAVQADKLAAARAIPEAVEAGITSGLVGADEKNDLAQALGNHAQAVQLFKMAALRLVPSATTNPVPAVPVPAANGHAKRAGATSHDDRSVSDAFKRFDEDIGFVPGR